MAASTTGLTLTPEERAVLNRISAEGGRRSQERKRAHYRAQVIAAQPGLSEATIEQQVDLLIRGEFRLLAKRPRPSGRRKNLKTR
jgi:hypothetical protein